MTEVIIDLNKIKENTKNIVKKYHDYKYFIAVVKTNAYGLGYDIVPSLVEGGVNYLAVSYLEEALKIRKIDTKTPILCLQPILATEIEEAIKNNITITISSLDYLKKLNINNKIKVHIKIDSGMNRLGIKSNKELKEMIEIINTNNTSITTNQYKCKRKGKLIPISFRNMYTLPGRNKIFKRTRKRIW